jgi:hypothetical protein
MGRLLQSRSPVDLRSAGSRASGLSLSVVDPASVFIARSQSESGSAFMLAESTVREFKGRAAPFGFNGLGELVYRRSYARLKSDGTNEDWWESVRRVVNGTFSMQKGWSRANGIDWDEAKAQEGAKEMYSRIFHMKFLPPGRGLWAMGSVITEERGLYAALNNCAFVSTAELASDPCAPFMFLMDAAMLGVGVGFDTRGAGKILIHRPSGEPRVQVVLDSREGWVDSTRALLLSYFVAATSPVNFDYSQASLAIPSKLRSAHRPQQIACSACTWTLPAASALLPC